MSDGMMLSFTGIAFGDDPERAFVLGVEFGQVFEQMQSSTRIEQVIHSANIEAVQRAAAALGWTVEAEEADETWTRVMLTKIKAGGGNPHGLRIVT